MGRLLGKFNRTGLFDLLTDARNVPHWMRRRTGLCSGGCGERLRRILDTGVGGGIAIDGRLLRGPNAIAGEWGHNPLPWIRPEWNELPGAECWCGRHGCIETWLSGVSLARDHECVTAERLSGEAIIRRAEAGEERATATLSRYEDRLARALAHVINLLDPDVIVLGGGVSRVERLYRTVPALVRSMGVLGSS